MNARLKRGNKCRPRKVEAKIQTYATENKKIRPKN